jgi:hypothetical protein
MTAPTGIVAAYLPRHQGPGMVRGILDHGTDGHCGGVRGRGDEARAVDDRRRAEGEGDRLRGGGAREVDEVAWPVDAERGQITLIVASVCVKAAAPLPPPAMPPPLPPPLPCNLRRRATLDARAKVPTVEQRTSQSARLPGLRSGVRRGARRHARRQQQASGARRVGSSTPRAERHASEVAARRGLRVPRVRLRRSTMRAVAVHRCRYSQSAVHWRRGPCACE